MLQARSRTSLTAVDDSTFRWALKQPYPKLLLALAKNSTPCSFIMPARIAPTDPFKPISEYIGSGPDAAGARTNGFPGAKAVFEKFADYVPRQEQPPGSRAASGCWSTAWNGS